MIESRDLWTQRQKLKGAGAICLKISEERLEQEFVDLRLPFSRVCELHDSMK